MKGKTERGGKERWESTKKGKKRREKSILTSGQSVGPQLYPKLSFFYGRTTPENSNQTQVWNELKKIRDKDIKIELEFRVVRNEFWELKIELSLNQTPP